MADGRRESVLKENKLTSSIAARAIDVDVDVHSDDDDGGGGRERGRERGREEPGSGGMGRIEEGNGRNVVRLFDEEEGGGGGESLEDRRKRKREKATEKLKKMRIKRLMLFLVFVLVVGTLLISIGGFFIFGEEENIAKGLSRTNRMEEEEAESFLLFHGGDQIHYYIKAEQVEWNYAPTQKDMNLGGSIYSSQNKKQNKDKSLGNQSGGPWNTTTWTKAQYREYTDDTFTILKERRPEEVHLGIMGPVIRARVGDVIIVHFYNSLSFPASIHPHGVLYTKANEGVSYIDEESHLGEKGDGKRSSSTESLLSRGVIPAGRNYTYRWDVPPRAGPLESSLSTVVWLYHSHADEIMDVQSGLLGPIVISRREPGDNTSDTPDLKPPGVDHEWFAFFTIFDEPLSHFWNQNVHKQHPSSSSSSSPSSTTTTSTKKKKRMEMEEGNVGMLDEDLTDPNVFHTINGYLSSNMPLIKGKEGEIVRWYLLVLGSEMDIHTVHFHGHTVTDWVSQRTDTVPVFAGMTSTWEMTLDNPGIWSFHCHVDSHMMRMTGLYEVTYNNNGTSSESSS